mmetsp:Transcript_45530/g.91155  ORF Transcript_45530/g.91155 Transcript_45530/m.91155 type:complete len:439 (-) Transcript_45530:15-1331(-)
MQKEIICLQIGQCGIQFGHEFWKNICIDHEINPEGFCFGGKIQVSSENYHSFFNQSSRNKYIPRAILLDLEPRIITNILNSTFGDLYDKNNVLTEKQGTGNNWANGYNRGIEYKEEFEEILRKETEKCNKLGSFNLFHSTVGGTGSGVGSLFLEIIRDEFPRKFLNSFSVIPNQLQISDVVVQPYNYILSMRWLSLYCDCVTFFENESIHNIIENFGKKSKISLLQINALIAKILGGITSSIRISNFLNIEFESLFAPLIPSPSLHFLFAGVSDYSFPGKKKNSKYLKLDHFKKALLNKTITSNLKKGKLISSMKYFTRKDSKEEPSSRIKTILLKNQIQCIEWAPVSLQSSFSNFSKNSNNPSNGDVFLFNHTCIKNLLKKNLNQYDLLRKRNAFLNSYLREFPSGEGLELFDDARENMESLLEEYKGAESKQYPFF